MNAYTYFLSVVHEYGDRQSILTSEQIQLRLNEALKDDEITSKDFESLTSLLQEMKLSYEKCS